MNREEFISELRESLNGNVSREVIEDTISYYNDYIRDAINNGASEEEVLGALGRGSFIAKTIIEANNKKETVHKTRSEDNNSEKGFHAEFNDDGTADIKYGKFKLSSWYGKVFIILAAVLLIGVIFAVIAGLFAIIINVILPIALLLVVIWIIVYVVKMIIK